MNLETFVGGVIDFSVVSTSYLYRVRFVVEHNWKNMSYLYHLVEHELLKKNHISIIIYHITIIGRGL